MILLPYRFCGDSHHAFAFPFVLIFLPLRLSCKESSTSNQAFSIVFTTPSVPLIGDRNLRRKDVTALLGAQNRYAIRLADQSGLRQVCGMGPPDCYGDQRLRPLPNNSECEPKRTNSIALLFLSNQIKSVSFSIWHSI